MNPYLFSVKDLARRWGRSESTIHRWRRDGTIPPDLAEFDIDRCPASRSHGKRYSAERVARIERSWAVGA